MLIASRISAMAGGGDTPTVPSFTQFEFEIPWGNYTVGIYSATAIDATAPTVIDWGDGNEESVVGDISQKTHSYAAGGTYTVSISDNISSIAMSNGNGYSNNRWTLTKVLALAEHVSTLPNSAFERLDTLIYFNTGNSGAALTLGESALANIGISGSAGNGNLDVDLSGREITILPYRLFYQSYYLHGVTLPSSLTTVANQAFYACGNYASELFDVVFPEGVASIGDSCFEWCGGAKSVTIPSTVTSMGNRVFYGASKISTLSVNRATAPTVGTNVFGFKFNESQNYFIGNESADTKTLNVPTGASGYTSGQWASPLCDANAAGFTLEYV